MKQEKDERKEDTIIRVIGKRGKPETEEGIVLVISYNKTKPKLKEKGNIAIEEQVMREELILKKIKSMKEMKRTKKKEKEKQEES